MGRFCCRHGISQATEAKLELMKAAWICVEQYHFILLLLPPLDAFNDAAQSVRLVDNSQAYQTIVARMHKKGGG